MRTRRLRVIILLSLCMAFISAISFWGQNASIVSAGKAPATGSQTVYLPFIKSQTSLPSSPDIRQVNAPYLDGTIYYTLAGIFWFGKVTPTENYADVRVAYSATDLYVRLTVFDRRIWCNTDPLANDPTVWDTVALYLDLNGNSGTAPDTKAYRFIGPFNWGVDCKNGTWPAAYRGNGTSWVSQNISFTADNWYRGLAGPNQNGDNDGWILTFQIPFASLGLSSAPSQGSTWGLGITLYDRDDAAGTPIANKIWPETFINTKPATWGQLSFGLPNAYVAPSATPRSTITIKNGVNGVTVKDVAAGGGFNCDWGDLRWNMWGETNYAGQNQINIQNQEDVADWPCFSKYYITFPLNSLPSSKVIISSTLTLYQFGNSGQGWNPGPYPSTIQVMTVSEDWTENTLTWNNAPLTSEYVSRSYVDPLDPSPPWPGIPRTWDVSRAVANAYASGQPLRLVLYSADSPMHSGKYFHSSDAGSEERPMLQVLWGDP